MHGRRMRRHRPGLTGGGPNDYHVPMDRTYLIVADIHGNLPLLEQVLDHAGYSPETHVLVSAGDLLDIGKQGWEVLQRLLALDAVLLLGNHEFAHILGEKLETESLPGSTDGRFDWKYGGPLVLGDLLRSGRMVLAHDADGVLVSHAGLSRSFHRLLCDSLFGRRAEPGLAEFVAGVNAAAREAAPPAPLYPGISPYVRMEWDPLGARLFGDGSMLWYRPDDDVPYGGWPQVAGHTPPHVYGRAFREGLTAGGFLLADSWRPEPSGGGFRYALVEEGRARIVIVDG